MADLLPASFRGVPFEVESTSDELGARSIKHEFPGRREAYAEPSGEQTPSFTVEAHIIGADYAKKLRALEDALNQPGPGKLVHPYRGTKLVALDGPVRVMQSTREGGMARLSIQFFEAGIAVAPTIQVDTSSLIKTRIPIVYLHIGETPFNTIGPDFLTGGAMKLLAGPRGVVNVLEKTRTRVSAAFGIVDDTAQLIRNFGSAVGGLLRSPQTLVVKLRDVVNALMTAIQAAGLDLNRGDKQRNGERIKVTMSALTDLGNFGDAFHPVIGATASRNQERKNQETIIDWVELTGLTESIGALTDIPLDNTAQASLMLGAVLANVERIQERGTISDGTSQALADLKAAFVAHCKRQAVDLPELGQFVPKFTQPALVIAWRLYADAKRDEEIIERNRSIENPLFVHGGVPITVSNA